MVDEEEEEEEDEGKELEEKGNTFADSSIGRRDKRKERNNTVVIKKIRGGRKPEDLASALLPLPDQTSCNFESGARSKEKQCCKK